MATLANTPLVVFSHQGTEKYPEGVGQTFKKGALLKITTGALVPWAAAADTGLLVAAEDASGVTGQLTACYRVDESTRFEINVSGVAVANEVATQIGIAMVSGVAQAARADVTNLRVEIVKSRLLPTDSFGLTGDTNVRMVVKPLGIGTNWK